MKNALVPSRVGLARTMFRRATGALPSALLDIAFGRAVDLMKRRHAPVFRRLRDFAGRRILIVPDEIGFGLILRLDVDRPTLVASPRDTAVARDATIRGTLPGLIGLLEGRIDGDALFFSRELVIEGDTELVLALRNAVDGADIDLVEDFCSLFGPAAGPAEIVCRRVADLAMGLRATIGRAT